MVMEEVNHFQEFRNRLAELGGVPVEDWAHHGPRNQPIDLVQDELDERIAEIVWDLNLKYRGCNWFRENKDEFQVPLSKVGAGERSDEAVGELVNYAESIALKFIYTYALEAWHKLRKREPMFTKETLQKIEDDYKEAYL